MASEIRVNKIENRSGLGTVTFADTGVDLSGIVTATTFSGSGASLTALPAGNLTGTVADARISTLTASKLSGALPAISAASLTNVPAANVVGVHTSLTVTNATTTGTAVVGGGVTISESGIEASGIGITVANINGGAVSGRRNFLINGAMQINQRITNHSTTNSYNPVTGAPVTLDRWKVVNGSGFDTDSAKVLKDTDSPDGFSNSLKWDVGNTETPTGGENSGIEQKIEAQNLQNLAYGTSSAKTMTLSFHVKSNKTGTYCVQLMQEDGTKYQLHEYTISSSATWEKKVITVVGNTANAIADDTGVGIRVIWMLACGPDDHVAASSTWTSGGSFQATSNQVNLFDNANNYWNLTGCQIEIGTQATEFEPRSHGEELALCQRYFQKSYSPSTETGTATSVGAIMHSVAVTQNYASPGTVRFPVQMRAVPTMTLYSAQTGTSGKINADTTDGVGAAYGTNENGTMFYRSNDGSGVSVNAFLRCQYTAEAEL